ncbi:hypothetical protein A2690_03430 [Candidatus Roizmanbacteria bacterium RIFCSPHIGHO2_01_FULL_39_12b]|uniref:Uncharacterized protein n=1 Tax=Candidatus Roizmanbacteria bacterium RIFCSPHIGHO2_01_FULL_39_12b TaxID=1802030 RepID=A0A1F7GDC5_9BACT|nr:MAG: hypothetical protein A2690_03430 [Candidatus Roizmanbacteria bacterium RIFCSPHIGHO2_01_FULL_39_12b]OGK47326.1 MAG: hypothetical protein A3B46_02215 [Candidatus Roizmanbacteria bacterium RIFCSPLOWO2_01_FULL_39_19]
MGERGHERTGHTVLADPEEESKIIPYSPTESAMRRAKLECCPFYPFVNLLIIKVEEMLLCLVSQTSSIPNCEVLVFFCRKELSTWEAVKRRWGLIF